MFRLMVSAILLVTTITCSDNNETIKRHILVADWTVTEVIHDGTLMPEWTGVQLTFEQRTSSGGSYSMTETKYDSIWSKAGLWTRSERAGELILDDTLSVAFNANSERLLIQKWLPWTGKPVCEDGICLPIVTGYWDFKFERDN